jgi:hypothetical protein
MRKAGKANSASHLHADKTSTPKTGDANERKPPQSPMPDPPICKRPPQKPAPATQGAGWVGDVEGRLRIVAQRESDLPLVDAVQPVFARRLYDSGAANDKTQTRRHCRAANTLLQLARRLHLPPETVQKMAQDDDVWAVLSRAKPSSLVPPAPSDNPLATPLLAPANRVFAGELVTAMILHGAPQAAGEYLQTLTPGARKMVVRQLREHADRPLSSLKSEHRAPFDSVLVELDNEFDIILNALGERHCFIRLDTAGPLVASLDYRDDAHPENFPAAHLAQFVADVATNNGSQLMLLDVLRQAIPHLRSCADRNALESIASTLIKLIADAIDSSEALPMLALLGVLQQIQQMDGCARICEQEMRAALKAVDPDRVLGCLQALVNTPPDVLIASNEQWKEALLVLVTPLLAVRHERTLIVGLHEFDLALKAPRIQSAIHPVLASMDMGLLLHDYPTPLDNEHWRRLEALVDTACRAVDTPEAALNLVRQIVLFLTPRERQPHNHTQANARKTVLQSLSRMGAAAVAAAARPLSQKGRRLAKWIWLVEATLALSLPVNTDPVTGHLMVKGQQLSRYAPCWRGFAEQGHLFKQTVSLLCHPRPDQMAGLRGEPTQQLLVELFLHSPPDIQAAILQLPDEVWKRVANNAQALDWSAWREGSGKDHAQLALALTDAGLITPDAQVRLLAGSLEDPELAGVIGQWHQHPASPDVALQVLKTLRTSALEARLSPHHSENLVLILLWLLKTLPKDDASATREAAATVLSWIDRLQGVARFDDAQLQRIGAALPLRPEHQDVITQIQHLRKVLRHHPASLVQVLIGYTQRLLSASDKVPPTSQKAHAKLLKAVLQVCDDLRKSLSDRE